MNIFGNCECGESPAVACVANNSHKNKPILYEVTYVRGIVTESGGGYVTVLVDRDQHSYPRKGASVQMTTAYPTKEN